MLLVVRVSVIVLSGPGGERNAAKDFGKAGVVDRRKLFRGGEGSGDQTIRDCHKLVGVGALITVSADRRCNGIDRNGGVPICDAGDVAQTVGGWRPRKPGGCIFPAG